MPSDFTQRLDEIAQGYQWSQVLFAAVRSRVFEHLQTPATAEELGAKVGWQPKPARMLLDALHSLEIVQKREGRYQNAPIAEACLLPGAEQDQRNILQHKANSYDFWGRIDEPLRSGEAIPCKGGKRGPEELRAFILGMADIAHDSAEQLFDAAPLPESRRLLDVGGGPGSYAHAYLRRDAARRATVLDLEEVLPIAREEAEKAGLLDRMDFVAGDLTQDAMPDGHDVILLSNIVHSYSDDMNADLVRRCAAALPAGGTLLIKDFIVDPERTGPAWSLLFALHMLIHSSGGGDVYSTEDIARWTSAARLEDVGLLDLTERTRLWVAQKG